MSSAPHQPGHLVGGRPGPGVADPDPVLVAAIDLDGELRELPADDHHREAWIVGFHDGVPQGIAEVPLPVSVHSLERLASRWLADQRERSDVPDDLLPMISVVVPSIVARTEDLARCLDSLAALDYPRFEVLLVDNRREIPHADALPDLVATRPVVRVVREERPGISAARNAGVRAARGAVVAFTDDDVQVHPRWLSAIGGRMAAEPDLEAVTGLILPAELETPAQIWFERYYGGFSGERTFSPRTLAVEPGHEPWRRARVVVRDPKGEPVRRFAIYGVGAFGAGANMAYRRSTLERLGGFDLALGTGTPSRGGEDLATLIDLLWTGGKMGYEPSAVVRHRHRGSYDDLVHQLRGNGLGFTAMLTSLIVRHPSHLLGLATQLPLAAQRIGVQTLRRVTGAQASVNEQSGEPASYPRALVLHELGGMPRGPVAYLRSRSSVRRWVKPSQRA